MLHRNVSEYKNVNKIERWPGNTRVFYASWFYKDRHYLDCTVALCNNHCCLVITMIISVSVLFRLRLYYLVNISVGNRFQLGAHFAIFFKRYIPNISILLILYYWPTNIISIYFVYKSANNNDYYFYFIYLEFLSN